MDKGISVIIACYNSSLLLRETIECIALQNHDNINVELIIVDNASDDNTYELALKYCKELLNITYRVEQQNVKGKNAALSLGYRLCRYSYVLICDDDNRLEPNYVKTAFAIMEANVSIGALGGIGYPILKNRLLRGESMVLHVAHKEKSLEISLKSKVGFMVQVLYIVWR